MKKTGNIYFGPSPLDQRKPIDRDILYSPVSFPSCIRSSLPLKSSSSTNRRSNSAIRSKISESSPLPRRDSNSDRVLDITFSRYLFFRSSSFPDSFPLFFPLSGFRLPPLFFQRRSSARAANIWEASGYHKREECQFMPKAFMAAVKGSP